MKPVQQLRIGWSLETMSNVQIPPSDVGRSTLDVGRSLPFEGNGYTTIYNLAKFDPKAEGFGDLAVDLTPRAATTQNDAKPTHEEGRRVAQMFGCAACHSQ